MMKQIPRESPKMLTATLGEASRSTRDLKWTAFFDI